MEDNKDKNWVSGVFSCVVDGFRKVLSSVKKHGWKTSFFTVVVIGLLWSLVINPINIDMIIEKHIDNRIQKEQLINDNKIEVSITKRENANYFVSDLMVNIIERFKGVNRVLLLEQHNGSSNLKGVDFLFSSCTYELVSESLINPVYLFDDLQRQTNMNLLGTNFLTTLKHKDYIFFDDLNKQSTNQNRLLKKLKLTGDNQSIIFTFKDEKHRPIIMLVISGCELNENEITVYIEQFKRQIEEMLIN